MILRKGLPDEFCVILENQPDVIDVSKALNKLGYRWQDGDFLPEWLPPEYMYPLYYKVRLDKLRVSYDKIENLDIKDDITLNFEDIWEAIFLYKEV